MTTGSSNAAVAEVLERHARLLEIAGKVHFARGPSRAPRSHCDSIRNE